MEYIELEEELFVCWIEIDCLGVMEFEAVRIEIEKRKGRKCMETCGRCPQLQCQI